MSYGQNLPRGLQAIRSLGAAGWNGQTNSYLIRSGYPNNIFKGDPVVVAGATDGTAGVDTGYLISLYDVAAHAFTAAATFGVFAGCSFITPTATNPIDPASPGRPYWPAGTITANNVPAIAFVIDDPNTIFDVQTTFVAGGAVQTDVGAAFDFVIPNVANIVQGNTDTGQSSVSVVRATPSRGAGTAAKNALCVAIVPSPPNPDTAGAQYNNIAVLIQNHQYAQRAIARA